MLKMGSQLETEEAANPKMNDYLRIALVHHHPYSYSPEETRLPLGYDKVAEKFLRFENAEEFVRFCAHRRVSVIMHGHKHLQTYLVREIELSDGASPERRDVSAVGCGSSLGVRPKAMSYNVLQWSPESKAWSVSFFADAGDGSGFRNQLITLHRLEPS
jgi:hypothetical protein